MQKLQDYWSERSSQQKAILVAAFVATFALISAFSWLATKPAMALLYGGLDPAQAGEVVSGIERSGVAYQVRGDAIWVDETQRDRLRMELAAQGLPTGGTAGYELLDNMSGFGTTSQMFDAAYWRAKEGELARTILALPNIKTARVHLAVENGRGYRRDGQSSASVTLTTNGSTVTSEQAAALKYLISSGVTGMTPESVTVIDTAHGIVGSGEDTTALDRADAIKRNVERILEPHVGVGNAIVELNLDLVTESEVLTEKRFDPQERAIISQLTEETSDQSSSNGSGAVTAASNLPDGDQAQGDSNQSARTENRQQANYEVSTVTREVNRRPGSLRRLTVAVLVNGVAATNAEGETEIIPRSDEELLTLRELVASTVGFDATRGDEITVKSLPFAGLTENGTLAEPGFLDRLELNGLARLGLIGIFALLIAAIVLRPVLRSRTTPAAIDSVPEVTLDESGPGDLPMSGMIEPEDSISGLDSLLIQQDDFSPTPSGPLSLPPADPVARLKNMMRERQEESAKVLSGWIDTKENAG